MDESNDFKEKSKSVKYTSLLKSHVLEQFQPFIDLEKLPDDLRISTITINCRFDTDFYLENIGKYIDIGIDSIDTIKYGDFNDPNTNRTLIITKKRTKRKGKKKKAFFNQATAIVKLTGGNRINVKIFKNGSIQMTGCKNGENCIEALMILCKELLKVKAVVDPKTLNKVIVKSFASDRSSIGIQKLKGVKIRMINSNFHVGFKINREKLYKILQGQGVQCTFEPIVHACVNIKYNYKDLDKISVFVYESGSIIITGAKHADHISEAYKYITTKIYENYNKIIINNLDTILKKYNIIALKSKTNDEEEEKISPSEEVVTVSSSVKNNNNIIDSNEIIETLDLFS